MGIKFVPQNNGMPRVLAKSWPLYRWPRKCQNLLTMHVFDRINWISIFQKLCIVSLPVSTDRPTARSFLILDELIQEESHRSVCWGFADFLRVAWLLNWSSWLIAGESGCDALSSRWWRLVAVAHRQRVPSALLEVPHARGISVSVSAAFLRFLLGFPSRKWQQVQFLRWLKKVVFAELSTSVSGLMALPLICAGVCCILWVHGVREPPPPKHLRWATLADNLRGTEADRSKRQKCWFSHLPHLPVRQKWKIGQILSWTFSSGSANARKSANAIHVCYLEPCKFTGTGKLFKKLFLWHPLLRLYCSTQLSHFSVVFSSFLGIPLCRLKKGFRGKELCFGGWGFLQFVEVFCGPQYWVLFQVCLWWLKTAHY